MHWAVQSDERRICLLGMEGTLGSKDLVNLAKRLRGLAAQGVSRVVVDLRHTEHWDYRGLRCLAEAVVFRRGLGGVTAFVTPSRYLRDIAAAAGVGLELDFYDELHMEGSPESRPAEGSSSDSGASAVRHASGLGP